jgi:hypothetical protein
MDQVRMSRLSLISTPKLDSAGTYRGYNVEYPSALLRNVQTNYSNMERLVDDRSKSMMLEHNIHDIFDKLKVYLELMEVSLQSCIPVIPHVDQRASEKTSTQLRMLGAPTAKHITGAQTLQNVCLELQFDCLTDCISCVCSCKWTT